MPKEAKASPTPQPPAISFDYIKWVCLSERLNFVSFFTTSPRAIANLVFPAAKQIEASEMKCFNPYVSIPCKEFSHLGKT